MSVKLVFAHHPYEASRDDEISFEKDEIIKVTDDTDPDWWVGKKKDGSLGFFPSNFVTVKEEDNEPATEKAAVDSEEQKVDTVTATEETASSELLEPEETVEETSEAEEKKVDQVIGMARVMEDYAMQEPGELTLPRGGIVNIYEIIDDEWSRGELNAKVGRYPSKYVEDIDMPGRPDLGRQQSAGSADAQKSPLGDEDGSVPKGGFKLAAFGVKQGGIGSLLAGGFPGLKKTGAAAAAKPETKPTPVEEKKEVITSPVEEKPKSVDKSPISPTTGVAPVPAFNVPVTSSAASSATEKPLGKAIVLHPYDADNEDELSLLRGEYVEILDRNADDGWWKGKNERGESGVFPSNFVKELEEDVIAPPTPTRARRSVNSTSSSSTSTENRPPSINSMARPPQVPRPSSVQTLGTTRPVTLNPRPSTINAPSSNTSTKAIPTTPATHVASPPIPESVEEAIKEEEQYEADEEKPTGSDLTSPVRSEVEESPLFAPKLAERSIVPPPAEKEEAVQSPPVIQEDPITDEEEKESGADEEPISRETSRSQDPKVEIVEEPTVTKAEEPKIEETKVEETKVKEPKVEEPKVEEPKVEEPKVEEPKVEEPKVEEPKVEEPEIKEPKAESIVTAEEIKQEEQAPIVVEEESEDEFKDATEQSAPIVSEQKPIVTEKEEEPIAIKKEKKEPAMEEPEVPIVVEEEKNEFDSIPTGPKLTAPTRVRIGAGRARRSPQTSQEPSQMEVLQKELESTPEEKPVIPEKPVSPPAKPIKPIFAKFPTPFAAGAEEISKRNLKPTQTRRLWDEKPAEESQPTTTTTSTDEEPVRPSGVKNIASRFNFNGGGGGSSDVLETKLKNHTKNEVEKVRKEFEHLLQEEREKRINLENIVNELLEKVKALEN